MSVEQEKIKEQVIEIIAEQLGQKPEAINGSSDIANDLGADSLDLAELMIAFEESFDINIDEEKLSEITTVDDVVKQICAVLEENE
ncbi:MAG: acyl carrier protein [Thermoguttaceae bacterium]|nr:acyl carrier protein [Thermoguttaceae bacterium]